MEYVTITQEWYTYLMLGFWVCVPSLIIFMILQIFVFSPDHAERLSEIKKLKEEIKMLAKENKVDIVT